MSAEQFLAPEDPPASYYSSVDTVSQQCESTLDLLENANSGFYSLDQEWRFTYLNRATEALLARSREQLLGKSIWEEFSFDPQSRTYQELHRARDEQRSVSYETYSNILRTWIEVEAYPTSTGLGVYFHDISQRKRIQAEQAHLTALVKSSSDAILSETPEGIITSWNPASESIFGYSAAEIIGQPITCLIPPERIDEEAHFNEVIMSRKTVDNYDTVRLRKDGSRIDVSVSLSPIVNERGEIVAAAKIIRDISERKQIEETQQRYAERLAAINHLDRVIAANVDIVEVYDDFIAELRTLVPVDRASLIRLNEAGDRWQVARRWVDDEPPTQLNRWEPVQESAIEWLVEHQTPLMETELGERGIWSETERLKRDGIRSRLLLPLIVEGRVLGVLAIASTQPNAFSEDLQAILVTIADQLSVAIQKADLYEQVQHHADELEQRVQMRTAELEASNKELEAFTYSVSHDLRAPLRAIDGFSRMLLRDYLDLLPEEGRRRLHVVRENAQQMGQLIDDLLAFSRLNRQPLNRKPLDLAALANQIMDDLRGQEKNHPLELVIDPLPPCRADPALLKQVMVNLLANAIKFTRKCEAAKIEIGYHEQDGELVYYVKDNGAGFDMRYADKLFGVFQRLHRAEDFEGTGVGLAIVQRIIHRHGGQIWAEAEVDKGACFYFTLGQEVEDGRG